MSWRLLDPRIRHIAETALTEKQLRVVKSRLDGHSFRKIGLALGIDEATARGHWDRALKKLKPHMERDAA